MILLTIPATIILSLLFTRLSHPLSMGLTLLTQTLVIALSAGLTTYSFLFSYILFLIFLGGMLVLFIYVASLASNEHFNFSSSSFFMFFFLFLLLTVVSLIFDPLMIPNLTMVPPSSINSSLSTPLLISWIYSTPSMLFTSFIILYLLLTLIVVVKLVNLFKGPLRFIS
uniref:NADH-ubiquinone oxidoreductase chain 6 n=1 Tax=Calappa bilineata TaxID=405176 RepID=A0A6G8IZX9_9EUCA|nr:NADH dehydrogenase subunit 6 [Calappa bilineata]QIM59227.1 NADH dehydrogenase subunit 6 [Calappa bilineata]